MISENLQVGFTVFPHVKKVFGEKLSDNFDRKKFSENFPRKILKLEKTVLYLQQTQVGQLTLLLTSKLTFKL